MKHLLIAFITLFLFKNSYAQKASTPCACCTPEFKQFDFWIGNWDVYDTLGNKVGENKILTMQDSCLIQENWKSQGQTGTSNNYYNKADSTWNQVWVDNSGTVLVLKGKSESNKMILKSEKVKGKKGRYYFNQITWEKNIDGTVTQTWDVLFEDNSLINRVFKGIYKRKLIPKKNTNKN